MKRRSFLKGLAAIPLISSVLRYLPRSMQAALASPTVRRVGPSDPLWPTAASGEKLKQQVGGQLIPVSSPLAPCKEAPGSAECAARVEEMRNPYFIGEQAGGTQTSGWLDGWTSAPSAYGSLPDAPRTLLRPSISPAITICGSWLKAVATATKARQTPRILY